MVLATPLALLPEADPARVRDAATVVIVRRDGPHPRILMGQRGAAASFMPDRFVFPGGALDPGDLALAGALAPTGTPDGALLRRCAPEIAAALPLAGVREVWEETGLALGAAATGPAPSGLPGDWEGYFATGADPRHHDLRFFFRAVTPPGRPRRFDARFFLADAEMIHGSPDDLSRASGELRSLHWIDIDGARALALPFITEVVLSEAAAIIADPAASRGVPWFRQDSDGARFTIL